MIREAHAFLQFLKTKRASPHTIRGYASDLDALCHSITSEPYPTIQEGMADSPTFPLESVSREHIRQHLASLHSSQKSRRTIIRTFASLRSFFRFCIQQGWITTDPMKSLIPIKGAVSLPITLSRLEIVRLLEAPDVSTLLGLRDRSILELLYSSGVRVSELVTIQHANLQLSERAFIVQGKGKKERRAFMTPSAAQWVEKYTSHRKYPHTPYLFVNARGTRLTERSVDRLCLYYTHRAGLTTKVTPHVLRHTMATHLLENGMDIKTIQLLLGHEHVETTTIYTKVSDFLKYETYYKAHPHA